MDDRKYLDAATQILDELKKLNDQKKAIESQISKLSNLFLANINMLPDDVRKGIATLYDALKSREGLTAAVTAVLTFSEMAAVDVRDALIKSGYDFSGQVNPLASVSTTLTRLADAGKIERREAEGRTVYKRMFGKRTRKPKV
jgi:hypothetical protein